MINFDEVADALVHNDELLKDVLRVLVDSQSLCYICILLTSTRALEVLQLPTSSQYHRFKGYLQWLEIFPLLVTCSLFGAHLHRSQRIDYEGARTRHHIARLEDSGVIFLVEPQSLPLSRRCSVFLLRHARRRRGLIILRCCAPG